MPPLGEHKGTSVVKAIVLGDPGSGKTGSLTSLVDAGYKLRIFDCDNLLTVLGNYVMHTCPDKIGNVAYQTFTDEMKGSKDPVQMIGGRVDVRPFVNGVPKAFGRLMEQLTDWKDPKGENLGSPSTWGPDCVVVIDSLTTCAESAHRYVQGMNPLAKDPQANFFSAQQLVSNMLALIASEAFHTNVLVLAHIAYDKDDKGNKTKGYPRSVGSALNEKIGGYFNTVLQVEAQGPKRVIRTKSTGIITLKNPADFKVKESLPLETGMAEFFQAVLNRKPTN